MCTILETRTRLPSYYALNIGNISEKADDKKRENDPYKCFKSLPGAEMLVFHWSMNTRNDEVHGLAFGLNPRAQLAR